LKDLREGIRSDLKDLRDRIREESDSQSGNLSTLLEEDIRSDLKDIRDGIRMDLVAIQKEIQSIE